MPLIKNDKYNQFHTDKVIDLITTDQLDVILDRLPSQKLPRKCSLDQAKTLITLLYYTGARPVEVMELKPKDIEEKHLSPTRSMYQLTIMTAKGGEKKRVLPIPKNKQTTAMFNAIKKYIPDAYYFYAFRSSTQNNVRWEKKKEYYIKENGEVRHETVSEDERKTYVRTTGKVNQYITKWCGFPPYFFRHNRFSFLADKGASDQQIKYYKGAKSEKSIEAYKNLSRRKHEELIKYF